MANVQIIQADNGEYNLIVDGEWYFEGTYDQVLAMTETFYGADDDEPSGYDEY